MLGQKGPRQFPAKKPTDFIANHLLLLQPLQNCKCDRSHIHDSLDGGTAAACQLWPWGLAYKVASGIAMLTQHLQSSTPDPVQAFPATGVGTSDRHSEDEEPDPENWRRCPGCRGRQSKYDPRHSRVEGECLWPQIEPISWNCPACKNHRPYGHPSHSLDATCKHAVVGHRF